mgnify:CR=1 FL=1
MPRHYDLNKMRQRAGQLEQEDRRKRFPPETPGPKRQPRTSSERGAAHRALGINTTDLIPVQNLEEFEALKAADLPPHPSTAPPPTLSPEEEQDLFARMLKAAQEKQAQQQAGVRDREADSYLSDFLRPDPSGTSAAPTAGPPGDIPSISSLNAPPAGPPTAGPPAVDGSDKKTWDEWKEEEPMPPWLSDINTNQLEFRKEAERRRERVIDLISPSSASYTSFSPSLNDVIASAKAGTQEWNFPAMRGMPERNRWASDKRWQELAKRLDDSLQAKRDAGGRDLSDAEIIASFDGNPPGQEEPGPAEAAGPVGSGLTLEGDATENLVGSSPDEERGSRVAGVTPYISTRPGGGHKGTGTGQLRNLPRGYSERIDPFGPPETAPPMEFGDHGQVYDYGIGLTDAERQRRGLATEEQQRTFNFQGALRDIATRRRNEQIHAGALESQRVQMRRSGETPSATRSRINKYEEDLSNFNRRERERKVDHQNAVDTIREQYGGIANLYNIQNQQKTLETILQSGLKLENAKKVEGVRKWMTERMNEIRMSSRDDWINKETGKKYTSEEINSQLGEFFDTARGKLMDILPSLPKEIQKLLQEDFKNQRNIAMQELLPPRLPADKS